MPGSNNAIRIPILPGGMRSDISYPDLSINQHREVTNIRQVKDMEWEVVKGYVNYFTGLTDLKAGIEITEEDSGDRFLLLQDGTSLKRIDYDDGDGNGYENESATTLTLPSGVTIDSSAKLRFFYHQGVVRITGASEPLWYGYVSRTLFPVGVTDNFEGENNFYSIWIPNSAKKSRSFDQVYNGTRSLKVEQTATDGSALRYFEVTVGNTYTISVRAYKPTAGGSGNVAMLLSRTPGGAHYGSAATAFKDDWVQLTKTITAATNEKLFVELIPGFSASSDYAYFDEFTIVDDAGNPIDTEHQIADWVMEKAALRTDLDLMVDNQDLYSNTAGGGNNNRYVFIKTFLVYDDAQYSILEPPVIGDPTYPFTNNHTTLASQLIGTNDETEFVRFLLTLSGSDLRTTFLNDRLTGIGIALATSEQRGIEESALQWKVVRVLSINEPLIITYTHSNLEYDGTNNDKLFIDAGETVVEDGFFAVGDVVYLKNTRGDILTTINALNSVNEITFDDDITDLVATVGVAEDPLSETTITIYKRWDYDSSSGYSIQVGLDIIGTQSFEGYTGFPATTSHNTPNYSHHAVIEDQAYVRSLEDEEADVVRFSVSRQIDNFPILNSFPVEVGDTDQVRAIVRRDNRLMILKRNSISQGNYIGSQWRENISLADNGLFAEYGYITIDGTIFWLDADDVYSFSGAAPRALMGNERMRSIFRENVDANSSLAYDKLENELWVCLNGVILVYHIERQEWYKRSTDITPLFYFRNYDKSLIVGAATKLVNYNHSEAIYDELISFLIRFRIIDEQSPFYTKKAGRIRIPIQSSGAIQVVADDTEKAQQKTAGATPSTTEVSPLKFTLQYLFKQLDLKIQNETAAANLTATIRPGYLEVERWR